MPSVAAGRRCHRHWLLGTHTVCPANMRLLLPLGHMPLKAHTAAGSPQPWCHVTSGRLPCVFHTACCCCHKPQIRNLKHEWHSLFSGVLFPSLQKKKQREEAGDFFLLSSMRQAKACYAMKSSSSGAGSRSRQQLGIIQQNPTFLPPSKSSQTILNPEKGRVS